MLWVRVRDAVTGALDSMTLADLAPEPALAPTPTEPSSLESQGATIPS